MFSRGKLCKLSRTMYNRQFIQLARIPVELVARLWDMSTQKYNNPFHSCCNLRASTFNISVQFRFTSFYFFSGAIKSSVKFLKVQSVLPRSGSLLWLVYVFFRSSQETFLGQERVTNPLERLRGWLPCGGLEIFSHINTSARLLLGFIPAALELYGW